MKCPTSTTHVSGAAGRRLLFLVTVSLLLAWVTAAIPQQQEQQPSTREKLLNLVKESESAKPATRKPIVKDGRTTRQTQATKTFRGQPVNEQARGQESPLQIQQVVQPSAPNSSTEPPPTPRTTEAGMSALPILLGAGALCAVIIFITIKRSSTMKWFFDLKLRTKLLTSFFLVSLVAAVIGIVGINQIREINAADTLLYEAMTVPLAELGDVQESVQGTAAQVYSFLLSNNQQDDQKSLQKIQDLQAKIDKDLASFEKSIIAQSIRDALKDFVSARSEYTPLLNKILAMGSSNRKQEAYAFAKSEVAPIRVKMAAALQKLVELKKGRAKETSDGNTQLASQAVWTSLVVMGIGIVLALALGVFLARVIGGPVKVLAGQAETVASGDLTVQVEQNSEDEIGQLAGSFKRMVESLRETIGQVGEASSAVASASSQISSSTEEMAAGAQEQTSQAGEVASAVEEMTKTIVENSKNASNTAETAKVAKEAAQQGGQVVEETVEGMKRIAEVVNKSADTVKALGKSSDQIGEIIGVIDDIADQTNLLALNAAIEAARAGEQGRGFAVVADEVRKLAERTTKATKEIAGMIKAIQSDTTGAVTSMTEGTKQVDEGIKLADKAGVSLREIVDVSQKVGDMVAQIAAASEEQSSASEQISKNVEAISSVTGETAQGVQQIARAAEDLNRLTENLQNLVGKFKLSGDGATRHGGMSVASKPLRKSTIPKSKVAVRENGALVAHE